VARHGRAALFASVVLAGLAAGTALAASPPAVVDGGAEAPLALAGSGSSGVAGGTVAAPQPAGATGASGVEPGAGPVAGATGDTGNTGNTGPTGDVGAQDATKLLPGPYPGPTSTVAYLAHVVVATNARTRPTGSAPIVAPVGTASLWVDGPVQLLVLGSVTTRAGKVWLRVRLPVRPNDASGWIPANDTLLRHTDWRLLVNLQARQIEAFHDGQLMRSFGIVIGKASTPTPTGLFAVYAMARQPAGSELGPWALHLTAHSNVLDNYGGGPGRVAIHGRAGPLLADPIGSASSHGCVRAKNDDIVWLAARVPLGTPVLIR
jgi:hypothetical protein